VVAMFTDRNVQAQGWMIIAEVIDTAQNPHARRQGIASLGQGAGAPCQRGQPLPKGGIEPFDKE
jgi:hypothetical protein